jgi:hypothetical protein
LSYSGRNRAGVGVSGRAFVVRDVQGSCADFETFINQLFGCALGFLEAPGRQDDRHAALRELAGYLEAYAPAGPGYQRDP